MNQTRVLISGIGIAGPTLAYWLKQYGFVPTLVEHAPKLRDSGYMIDFWGLGYEAAERMAMMPAIRRDGYRIQEVRIVDAEGERVSGLSGDIFRKSLKDRFISLPRGDLARLLFERIDGQVETIFGDGIAAIEMAENDVGVRFHKARARRFDLVIGADGLHSQVRSLAFGDEARFEEHLGYGVAAFNVSDYPRRDADIYVSYCVPGRQAARYSLRDNRTGFLLIFRTAPQHRTARLSDSEKRTLLHSLYDGAGWECAEIRQAMDRASDLYFDNVSQIHMPAWSKGRVALVGDAAFCPSLLAGEGSSLAMAGAYVLAGELKRAAGEFGQAFQRYEAVLKPIAEDKQSSAAHLGSWFAPKTRFGILIRNWGTRLMNIAPIGRVIAGRMFADEFQLPSFG